MFAPSFSELKGVCGAAAVDGVGRCTAKERGKTLDYKMATVRRQLAALFSTVASRSLHFLSGLWDEGCRLWFAYLAAKQNRLFSSNKPKSVAWATTGQLHSVFWKEGRTFEGETICYIFTERERGREVMELPAFHSLQHGMLADPDPWLMVKICTLP